MSDKTETETRVYPPVGKTETETRVYPPVEKTETETLDVSIEAFALAVGADVQELTDDAVHMHAALHAAKGEEEARFVAAFLAERRKGCDVPVWPAYVISDGQVEAVKAELAAAQDAYDAMGGIDAAAKALGVDVSEFTEDYIYEHMRGDAEAKGDSQAAYAKAFYDACKRIDDAQRALNTREKFERNGSFGGGYLLNLTPHPVVMADGDDRWTLPSQGSVRVQQRPGDVAAQIGPVPVHGPSVYGEAVVTGPGLDPAPLPAERPDTMIIVSLFAAQALPDRTDLIVPGTGPADGCIRDASGRIEAITRFVRA